MIIYKKAYHLTAKFCNLNTSLPGGFNKTKLCSNQDFCLTVVAKMLEFLKITLALKMTLIITLCVHNFT